MTSKSVLNCLYGIVTATFLLIFQAPVFAQYDFSAIDRILERNKKEIGADIVVMVASPDKILYKKELGEMRANSEAPLADASKWLTAAVIMQAVDEGTMTLDDKLVDYIPLMEKYKKSYIAIRHCLSHTTGLEASEVSLNAIKKTKYETLQEEVNDFITKRDIKNNPGEEFWYSNVGLNMAARIMELKSKNKSFDRIAQEKFFRPMTMKTNFRTDGVSAVNPSAGGRSNAADYIKFLQMILNNGMFNGKHILSENAIAAMHKPQITADMIKYAPKAAEGFLYGYGNWVKFSENNPNQLSLSHSSGLFGPYVMIDHCNKYALVILVPELSAEKKKDEIYKQIKGAIDEALSSSCE